MGGRGTEPWKWYEYCGKGERRVGKGRERECGERGGVCREGREGGREERGGVGGDGEGMKHASEWGGWK